MITLSRIADIVCEICNAEKTVIWKDVRSPDTAFVKNSFCFFARRYFHFNHVDISFYMDDKENKKTKERKNRYPSRERANHFKRDYMVKGKTYRGVECLLLIRKLHDRFVEELDKDPDYTSGLENKARYNIKEKRDSKLKAQRRKVRRKKSNMTGKSLES